ncbi:MAG TPA: ABC transporter permease [Thermotogae bacterium]|nr:ABC transporter permease [Thermotogota bacterium]
MLPAVLLLAFFVIYPSVRTIYISFFDEEGHPTLKNYAEVLTSRDTFNPSGFKRGFPLGTLLHNLIWIGIHLPASVILGLLLATLLQNMPGSSFVKSIIFLGMVMPMIVGGVMIRFMFDKNVGVVNLFLQTFGIEPRTWTAYPESALFSLIFGSIWLWTGFSMVLYSAGLETIPKEYYEAAQIDGAGRFRQFIAITVPLLKPITTVVVTMTLLWELKVFDIVYVATMGGPGGASNVLALQMYTYAFREFNFNRSAVVAVIITVSTLAASIPMIKSSLAQE